MATSSPAANWKRCQTTLEQFLRKQGLSGAKLAEGPQAGAADALRDKIDQFLLVQKAKDLTSRSMRKSPAGSPTCKRQQHIADPDKFHDWVFEQIGITVRGLNAMT